MFRWQRHLGQVRLGLLLNSLAPKRFARNFTLTRLSRQHAEIWSHPGHYQIDPYTSPRTSRHLVLDKRWCHVTCPKDECFSNFTETSAGPYWWQIQRCQHSIYKMLNDFETQPKKCLTYDEMVKNFPIFCLISTIFFAYIKATYGGSNMKKN